MVSKNQQLYLVTREKNVCGVRLSKMVVKILSATRLEVTELNLHMAQVASKRGSSLVNLKGF